VLRVASCAYVNLLLGDIRNLASNYAKKSVAHENLERAGTEPTGIQLLVLDIDGTIAGESNSPTGTSGNSGGAKWGRPSGDRNGSDVLLSFTVSPGRRHSATLAYQGAWIQDPATQQLHRHWSVPKQTGIAGLF